MDAEKIVWVEGKVVMCDGSNSSSGHPKVYYTFDAHNQAKCGYCGQVFCKKELDPTKSHP